MSERPNLLVIMSDQHSPHVLGCEGDPVVRTPNLDALAAQGTLFENAYCQSPLCVPSRMSFLTARHPSDIGVWTNGCILPSDTTTFAHSLGAAGYETALIGRMHFVGADQWHGFEHRLVGSLTWVYPGDVGVGLTPELASGTGQGRKVLSITGPGRTAYQVYDEEVAQTTADFLQARANGTERPFCIVAGFVLPHCPFVCPPDDWEYYSDRITLPEVPEGYFESLHPAMQQWLENRGLMDVTEEEIRRARIGYYGIVTHFDRQVGVIMEALERSGLADDTMVVYVSDHGEMGGEHGMWWKSCFYEGSASVPVIVSWPARWEGGRRPTEVTSLVDIGPTLVDLAGAGEMIESRGRSLVPLLEGTDDTRDNEAFSEHYASQGVPAGRMVRNGPWKLVQYEGYEPQLFNLEEDPHEFEDRAGDPSCATVRERLKSRVQDGWSPRAITKALDERSPHRARVHEWGRAVQLQHNLKWVAPPGANTWSPGLG